MALLQYDVAIVGERNIERALASIERRFALHNARVSRAFGGARGGGGGAGGGGGVKNELRSAEREQRRQMEYWRRASVGSQRLRDQMEDRAAQKRERQIAREHQIKIRGAERLGRIEEGARINARREFAAQQIAARREFVRGTVGGSIRNTLGSVATVGKAGAAMLGIGGAGLAASAVTGAARLDEQVRRLIIGGRGAGETSKYQPDQLRKQFERTGIETGTAPEALAGAAQTFVAKTGDIDTAVKNMRVFATVAQATGASVEDVASAAADLSTKMDIKSVDDMSQALATLVFQGKHGAFELRDMAQYLPEITAAASTAGVRGTGGMQQLGGMLQIARNATGSGAEGATAIEAMFRQLGAKSKDIQSGKAFGGRKVNVFEKGDPTKPMRNFVDVISEIVEASRGNIVQLQDVFDIRGIKAVNPLIAAYRNANAGAGGGKAGRAAGRSAVAKIFDENTNVTGTYADVQKDASDAMQSFSVQLEVVTSEMKEVMADELFPVVRDLVPEMKEFVPVVGRATRMLIDFASVAAEHPFATIGTYMAAQVAAEIGKAQLAKTLEEGISSRLAGAGLVVGTIAATIAAAELFVASMEQKAKDDVNAAAKRAEEVRSRASQEIATQGKLSPETRAALEQTGAAESKSLATAHSALQNYGVGDFIRRGFNSLTGGDENLQQLTTLGETAKNEGFNKGADETKRLLMIDDLAKRYGQSASDAFKQGVEEAADALKQKIEGAQAPPNRGNAPSPVKP